MSNFDFDPYKRTGSSQLNQAEGPQMQSGAGHVGGMIGPSAADQQRSRRVLAMNFAVQTHGGTCDEIQIVNAAKVYFDFVENGTAPEEV